VLHHPNQSDAGKPPGRCPDCRGTVWPPSSTAHRGGCPSEAATWAQARADLDQLTADGIDVLERALSPADAAELALHVGEWPHGRQQRRRFRVRVQLASSRGVVRTILRDGRPVFRNGVLFGAADRPGGTR